MKLKTSLFKKGLIISDIKRFWWVSVIYALALFFVMPFNHYMHIINSNNSLQTKAHIKATISNDLIFNGGVSQFILLVVPILIGTLVFRYMQKSRQASLFHSLPLTRTTLYISSIVSAITLFTIPLLLNTIIMLIMNCFSSLSDFYSVALIFTWLGYSLLFGIMFIAMSAFVGMFTGSSIAQLAFIYILNVLPLFLVEYIRINLKGILYGFDTYSNIEIFNDMPLSRLFNIGLLEHPATIIFVYIAVTIVLLIGGLFAFKIRRPETAGDIITFKPIRPIFVYGFVTCATLVGGAYFIQVSNASLSFVLLGYFISSIISYIVVQMITNKSLNILHTYKGYLGFALILVILTMGIRLDVIGYVNKIPDPNEVQETYLGYDIYWFEHKDDPNFDKDKYSSTYTFIYKDPQNIENMTKLHQYVLDNRSKNGNQQYISYKLKNGKKLIRKYSIDIDNHASVLAPIYKSDEYMENRYPILYQEAKDIKYIEINDLRAAKEPFIVSDKAQLESFKTALRQDIQKLDYSDLVLNNQDLVTITITDTKDKHITYALRSDYTNILDWLKKEGIYEQIIVKPENVESIILQSMNYTYEYTSYGRITSGRSLSDTVEITDKAVIKEILELSSDCAYSDTDTNYRVMIEHGTENKYNHTPEFLINFKGKVISPELQRYLDMFKTPQE